jgi:hypothetical protein
MSRQNLHRLLPEAARALQYDAAFRKTFSESSAGHCFGFLRPYLPKGLVSKLKGIPDQNSVSDNTAAQAKAPLLDERPLILPPEMMVRRLGAKTEFCSRKAEQLLEYKPAFDLARGMALTEQWARWANLVPERRA